MKLGSRLVIFGLLLAMGAAAQEEKKLYKWKDEFGNTVFSDKPQPGAVEIPMKQVPTIHLETLPVTDILETADANARRGETTQASYAHLDFSSPLSGGVLHNNAALIELSASLSPALKANHQLQFFLDGVAVSKPSTETHVTIKNAAYGPHSALFKVVDSQGNLVQQSEQVSFALLHVVRKKKSNPNQ